MSTAEMIASANKLADKYAPADQCAPRITPDERRRLVRRGMITMPERHVENRGRKTWRITPEMEAFAIRCRAENIPMKQIAVGLRCSVSCLQRHLLRKNPTP